MSLSIEQLLLQETHIVKIEPPEERHLPDINYHQLVPHTKEIFIPPIEYIKDFLRSYYVVDDFTDHAERQVWKKEFQSKHGLESVEYLNRNCLRGNRTFIIRSGLGLILDFCDQDLTEEMRGKIESVKDYIQSIDEKYALLNTPEEKIVAIKKMKNHLFQFLNYLSAESKKQ